MVSAVTVSGTAAVFVPPPPEVGVWEVPTSPSGTELALYTRVMDLMPVGILAPAGAFPPLSASV